VPNNCTKHLSRQATACPPESSSVARLAPHFRKSTDRLAHEQPRESWSSCWIPADSLKPAENPVYRCLAYSSSSPRANGAQLAAGSKARELKDTLVFSNIFHREPPAPAPRTIQHERSQLQLGQSPQRPVDAHTTTQIRNSGV
jgi:hypothetical protein